MENGPVEIVDLPIEHCVFAIVMSVYEGVMCPVPVNNKRISNYLSKVGNEVYTV